MDSTASYQISMFPVNNGDAFLLEFNSGGAPFNIMIDCGPSWTALEEQLRKLDSKTMIDLLILTHIDDDHINGALGLMKNPIYKKRIRQVWHNSLEQLAPLLWTDSGDPVCKDYIFREMQEEWENKRRELEEIDGPISASQSISLSVKLKHSQIPVNPVAITSQTESVALGKGKDIIIDFLLPTKDALCELLQAFSTGLGKMLQRPKMTDAALEAFDAFVRVPREQFQNGHISGSGKRDVDDSPANLASIAVVIRFNGKKFLFPGDAVDAALLPALHRWQNEHTGEDLTFDVVKLPHHGSTRSCYELLKDPDFKSQIYLVSTNGSIHKHPDLATINQLKEKCKTDGSLVYFNYQNIYDRFDDPKGTLPAAFSVKYKVTDGRDDAQ